jgi:hypothetical protein
MVGLHPFPHPRGDGARFPRFDYGFQKAALTPRSAWHHANLMVTSESYKLIVTG